MWLDALRDLALTLCVGQAVLALVWEWVSCQLASPPGMRIQNTKADIPKYATELFGSTVRTLEKLCLTYELVG